MSQVPSVDLARAIARCPHCRSSLTEVSSRDGLCEVHRARCFLELDMGTATNAVLADKVRAYAAYLRTAHYAEAYGEASCLLLWVAAGTRRLENALRTLGGAVRDEPALRGRVLAAALEALTPGTALGPVWRVADSGERRALVRQGLRYYSVG